MGKAGESFSLFSWQPFSPSGANGSDRFSAQLSEVLDGADHLAGVAVLVVVPGHDLHLIGVVVDLGDHGLGGIEQRAVAHADDVRGDDRILVVAEALGGSSLHGSVDGLLGDVLALDNGNQDGGGAGGDGNALSRADQLAVQLGDDQADGLGSAGGVRNDVLSTSTSAAQVALTLRAVQDHLVAGVSMNGGHDAGDDGISLVQGVGHGGQAVGGAGSSGDDLILSGQGLLVDGEDISTMPIEYAPQFTKEYNPEICDELGITVPDDYVAIGADDAADEEETSEDADAEAADDTAEEDTAEEAE